MLCRLCSQRSYKCFLLSTAVFLGGRPLFDCPLAGPTIPGSRSVCNKNSYELQEQFTECLGKMKVHHQRVACNFEKKGPPLSKSENFYWVNSLSASTWIDSRWLTLLLGILQVFSERKSPGPNAIIPPVSQIL